jgi:hypothetical protein
VGFSPSSSHASFNGGTITEGLTIRAGANTELILPTDGAVSFADENGNVFLDWDLTGILTLDPNGYVFIRNDVLVLARPGVPPDAALPSDGTWAFYLSGNDLMAKARIGGVYKTGVLGTLA